MEHYPYKAMKLYGDMVSIRSIEAEDVHDSLMSVSDAVRKYTCFVLEQYREHAWKNGIALQDMMSWAQRNIK